MSKGPRFTFSLYFSMAANTVQGCEVESTSDTLSPTARESQDIRLKVPMGQQPELRARNSVILQEEALRQLYQWS